MARNPFHVHAGWEKTNCKVCGETLFTTDGVECVCIRPCGLTLGAPEEGIQELEAESTIAQLCNMLGGFPSQLESPAWTDLFALPHFANQPVATGGRLPVHFCANLCHPDALEAALRKWPDSVRATSEVCSC